LRCATPRYDPGGGGINVARAIHALGGRATAIFPVGGPNGRMLCDLLEAEAVSIRVVPIAGRTRESFTVDEAGSGRQYRFVMPGPSLSQNEFAACLEILTGFQPRPDYIIASGSLPPEMPADSYREIAATAARLQARMILDTSGAALQIIRQCRMFLIKPNRQELAALTGRAVTHMHEVEAAAAQLVSEGCAEIVVASLGAEGAIAVTAEGGQHFPAIKVTPRSTVGAGDSMIAGIVHALSLGRPLGDSIRFGMAAGAAALLRPGTELCRLEDVERLLAEHPATDAACA
jgi:6-phosphofructokinase 2